MNFLVFLIILFDTWIYLIILSKMRCLQIIIKIIVVLIILLFFMFLKIKTENYTLILIFFLNLKYFLNYNLHIVL